MNIKIISVGGYKIDFIKKGIEYYIKKIKYFSKIEIIVPQFKLNFSSKQEKLRKEAEFVLKKTKDDFVILCDIQGKKYDSLLFAKEFEKILNYSKDISFIIGGDEGFDPILCKRADLRVSFSDFTLNHELFLVVLLETIYRSFTIIKNYPYHK
ncbi:MAG: 23S rRNA (pseudouridine(1915)-N(3))-methyltransferase RlmH [Elusimicrobiota bacterium]